MNSDFVNQHPVYRALWGDPELEERIARGIAANRQGDILVRLTDADGQPVAGVAVELEQTTSEFRFGANSFMLGAYPNSDYNARYEAAYAELFNATTVPFYWRGLEPERGRPRYAADSAPVERRPAPDAVLAFCERHGLAPHGHTLVWDLAQWSVPDWVPEDPEASEPLWRERVRDICARYGDRIPRWDVVNEVLTGGSYPRSRRMPTDYAAKGFAWAAEDLPAGAELYFNEVTSAWDTLLEPMAALVRRLMADGARLGGLGLQFHLFQDADLHRMLGGGRFRPSELRRALDMLGGFGLPIHVSEITLTSPGNTEEGLALQAEVARNLYRLWFSHPAVEAITWWNVPDGGAADGENAVFSGLLDAELRPKPAYYVLKDLIHSEWRTRARVTTDARGEARLRGFHGGYAVRVPAWGEDFSTQLRAGEAAAWRFSRKAEMVSTR